jgi:hypothetical protein
MTHPLVEQLRFTRREFRRGLQGLSEADAAHRVLPMNCISWNVGHMAWQEQRYFLRFAQGKVLLPEIDRLYRYGAEACTPALAESLSAWEAITAAADPWLDALTTTGLQSAVGGEGWIADKTFGSLMLRTIYHYWYQ